MTPSEPADALIDTTIVAVVGREKAQHGYRVTVVGDDRTGYAARPETLCGRIFTDATRTRRGVITCGACLEENTK